MPFTDTASKGLVEQTLLNKRHGSQLLQIASVGSTLYLVLKFDRDLSCNGPFGTKAHNILTPLFHFHQNPKTMPSASVAAVTHSLG